MIWNLNSSPSCEGQVWWQTHIYPPESHTQPPKHTHTQTHTQTHTHTHRKPLQTDDKTTSWDLATKHGTALIILVKAAHLGTRHLFLWCLLPCYILNVFSLQSASLEVWFGQDIRGKYTKLGPSCSPNWCRQQRWQTLSHRFLLFCSEHDGPDFVYVPRMRVIMVQADDSIWGNSGITNWPFSQWQWPQQRGGWSCAPSPLMTQDCGQQWDSQHCRNLALLWWGVIQQKVFPGFCTSTNWREGVLCKGGALTSAVPEPSAGRAFPQCSPREGSRVSGLCWPGRTEWSHTYVDVRICVYWHLPELQKSEAQNTG